MPIATACEKAPETRNAYLDLARLVGAFAVIWIHTVRSPELEVTTNAARFAVPFFASAAGFAMLVSSRSLQLSWAQFGRSRLARLYVPFLIWSAVYLLFKILKRMALPDQECELPGWEFWIVGGAYHLWFIPFLLISSLILFPIARISRTWSIAMQRKIAWSAFGIGVAIAAWGPQDDGAGQVSILFLQAIPGLLWGCSLGWLYRIDTQLSFPPFPLMALFFIAMVLQVGIGRSSLLESGLGLLLLLIVCLQRNGNTHAGVVVDAPKNSGIRQWVKSVAGFGQVAMGVYFVHLLILKIGEAIAAKAHWSVSPATDFVIFLIVCASSLLLSGLLASWSATRRLVV